MHQLSRVLLSPRQFTIMPNIFAQPFPSNSTCLTIPGGDAEDRAVGDAEPGPPLAAQGTVVGRGGPFRRAWFLLDDWLSAANGLLVLCEAGRASRTATS
jgi:hypothetical protein